MAGSGWEWCSTVYETGSEDLDTADDRVLRGGSWSDNVRVNLRVDCRIWNYPRDGSGS